MSRCEREALIDCAKGRALGCNTYCCRLLVRLTAEERAGEVPGVSPPMSCVPKDAEGLCIHFDRETSRCRIWQRRPRACREYDCNQDDLLQVVLREGFSSLKELVTRRAYIPKEQRVQVPGLTPDGNRRPPSGRWTK